MAGDKPRILVVDDEPNIRELIRLYLEKEGFTVVESEDGQAALDNLRQEPPDLAILDLMLPKLDGREVCREVRKSSSLPIIMLTARDEEVDRVLGLEMGADDYLTKPFSPRELVARVRAVLRRANPERRQPSEALTFPHFSVNHESRELKVEGAVTPCPAKEFDLLWLFVNHPHRVFTREQLLQQVWEYDYFGDLRTVDVHVRRLREKIEPKPEEPRYIKTVWGVGYKFEAAPC
ncbi:MAG TPA: response regulator transcription factor [Bacillota bacterium]